MSERERERERERENQPHALNENRCELSNLQTVKLNHQSRPVDRAVVEGIVSSEAKSRIFGES